MTFMPGMFPVIAGTTTVVPTPVVISGTDSGTSSGGTESIGDAASDRIVCAVFTSNNSSISNVVIGGVSATSAVSNTDGNADTFIFYAQVPTGTTAVLTYSGGVDDSWTLFRVTGWDIAAPTIKKSSGDGNRSIAISIPFEGGAIAVFGSGNQNDSVSWTNMTEYNDSNNGTGQRHSSAYSTTAGDKTITASNGGGGADSSMCVVIWS